MAISAFKSTTKRVCSIGLGNEPESSSNVPFQPSTPFNKQSLRRTRSSSDFSSRYLSDSASVSGDANSKHLDSLFRQGRVSSRYQSDDSESDADSMYSRPTYRSRQIAEIGAARKAALQNGKSKGAAKVEIRRASSNVDGGHSKEISDFLRCLDDPSDTESAYPRYSSARSRSFDVQSDTESVFSRLTRPRQSAALGPPRTGATQSGRGKGTRAGALRRSTSQLDLSSSYRSSRDDQSETESSSSRQTYRSRQNSDFGGSTNVGAGRRKGTRAGALRRSASQSQAELSDSPSLVGYGQPSHHLDDSDSPEEAFYELGLDRRPGDEDGSSDHQDGSTDHPEEEKTIRAVHTQNKKPGAQELDAFSLYDAMRIEMQKAVSEIRSEIEQNTMGKAAAPPSLSGGLEIIVPGEDNDNDSSVSEVRQEYAAKLEQSEKRAQDLWIQLAAEERRCLDLVKFVKELLPPQPGSGLKPRAPPPLQLRPLMGPETEQELVSQCLDADAQRYFDECVSISGLDMVSVNDASSCGVGYQESESPAWSVKDMTFSPRKKSPGLSNEKKAALLEPLITFCAQTEQNGRDPGKSSNLFARARLNDDGLVLPWLQWETDVDFSFQDRSGIKDGSTFGSLTASSSRTKALKRSSSMTWLEARHESNDEQQDQSMDLLPGVSGLGCLSNGDLSSWKSIDFGHLRNVGVSSMHISGRYEGQLDVDMFMLQRMWLRPRLKDGSILICGGIRL